MSGAMSEALFLLAGIMVAALACRWAVDGCATCEDGADEPYEVFFGGVLVAGWITCELIKRLFLHLATLAAMGVTS